MEYRKLGTSGLSISQVVLGTWVFERENQEDATRIIHQALDAGINLIDSANVYRNGQSEEVVGEAIKGRRDQVVLATKVFGGVGTGPNDRGSSRGHIMREVENSLRRLQTDYIDLYQIHAWDRTTSLEETLRALDDLVHSGKVRYIGSSNYPAWMQVESFWISDKHNLHRFICHQPPYSLFNRSIESDTLPVCERFGSGVITWSPLDFGWLTGKYRRGQDIDPESRVVTGRTGIDHPDSPAGQRKLDLIEQLLPLAQEAGATLSQYALAWVMSNPAVTAPILGPRTPEQLADNLGALEVKIPPEHLAAIDEMIPRGTRV